MEIGGGSMFIVEFLDQNKNVFRQKHFFSPSDMQTFINQFQLIEGREYTFFDRELNLLHASFKSLSTFFIGKSMGFKLEFDIPEKSNNIT